MARYQITFTAFICSLIFWGCHHSNSPAIENIAQLDKVQTLACDEIVKYPSLFSYKTDSLRNILQAKGKAALTQAEKERYFTKNDKTEVIYDDVFEIFPVNKITYKKSAVVIYLVKLKNGEYPYEADCIVLVMYNHEDKPMETLNIGLQDAFSTREINMVSPVQFEIIDTDDEYSPDPESEAKDIKNGYKNEAIITKSVYQIDTLLFRFK